jgi:hypothetical protein
MDHAERVRSQAQVRERAHPGPGADDPRHLAPRAQTLLTLQQLAGNAAVQRLTATGGPTAQRDAAAGGASWPPPMTGKKRALYEQKLKWVVPKLAHLQFKGTGPPRYDPDYWYLVQDSQTKAVSLVLKPDADPAPAIKELIAKPQKWAVDCAMWVQIAELYALGSAMGFERFNKLATPSSLGVLQFALRPQGSTGVRRQFQWTRQSSTGPVERRDERGRSQPGRKSMDAIVAEAPVGSRVAWTAKLIAGSEFSHENAVKLGPDTYGAHGFGSKTQFTRQELEGKLIDLTRREVTKPREYLTETISEDAIRSSVFLSEVEEYQVP